MKKAYNMSAAHARLIKCLPDDVVLISINDEHQSLYPLTVDRNSSKVFTTVFSDVTTTLVKNDGKTYHDITPKQAREIVDFIDLNIGKEILVHCQAGISRSGAVAMYLHIEYGYELKPNFWLTSEPNPIVLGRLLLEKKKKNGM